MLRLSRSKGWCAIGLFLAGAGMFVATVAFPWRLTAQGGQPIAGTGAVTGACHVSPIVADLDKSAHFYHDLLGLNLVPAPPPGRLPLDTRPEHLDLHGLPQAKLRFIGARMPGVFCGVELVEFTGTERKAVQRRMQDPGAAMLILLVRDIDSLFARLKADGVPVVTTGGVPVTVGASKTKVVVVKDPDGHPVELAQLDPLPATAVDASSNVIGIRLRVTVADTDRTVQYYRRVLGIEAKPGSFTKNDAVMGMMGLPPGEYRLSTVSFPGSALLLEFIEFKGLDPMPLTSRVQDPGSYRLQLNVRDIDATIGALKGAGSRVVSTGAEPIRMGFGTSTWRLAIAPELNNLFLIVQQRLEPAIAIGAAAQPQSAAPRSVTALSWMAGSWAGVSDGVEMEEHWTSARGGTMVGMHRDIARGKTVSFEFARIEEQGGAVVYLASPGGAPATPFRLVEATATRAVFENPAHDFPQRVIYWKDGADLRARIEGTQGGKAASQEWRWRPASLVR